MYIKLLVQLGLIQFVQSIPLNEGQNKPADSRLQLAWNWPGENIKEKYVKVADKPETKEPLYNKTHNPCTTLNIKPKNPNFSSFGRRISEAKCLEYLWEIKERNDYNRQADACGKYLNLHDLVKGRKAEPGEFRHMAAIGWRGINDNWIFQCGGTIISPKFIVTAAHCSRASSRDSLLANPIPEIVRIGAKNIETKIVTNNTIKYVVEDRLMGGGLYPLDVKISRITKHPNYLAPKKYFDIAVMKLETDVYFGTQVLPACLWSSFDVDNLGTKASVSGWGTTKAGIKETTTELQAGDLDIIDNNTCNELLQPLCNRHWCGLQEHQMCSGQLAGGTDTCQGDSGGPLQVEIKLPEFTDYKMYYLLGVTSFGFGCGRANQPGVYTRIASFIDWIESIVWPNELASGKYKFDEATLVFNKN